MDKEFVLVVGSARLDQQLEFRANSVKVDNPTNQWVFLDGLGAFIPQYTLGATYPLNATTRAQASFTAPAGQVEPPIIAAQAASITFYDLALPSTSGVGMLGGRAPYYDRNPASFIFAWDATSAPHAATARWTYTVPAGRRAYLEAMQAITEIQTAYTGAGNIDSVIVYQTVAGNVQNLLVARIGIGTVVGARADIALGGSFEMQATEIIQAQTADPRVGGTSLHYVTAKVTEFDA